MNGPNFIQNYNFIDEPKQFIKISPNCKWNKIVMLMYKDRFRFSSIMNSVVAVSNDHLS